MPYRTQSPDTHPEIERILIEAQRRMTPAEKLAAVRAMNRAVANMQRAEIRQRHPDADEHEVRMRLASRWLPAEIMRKVYNWDPDKEGY